MRKLILASVATFALSSGAVFATTTPPASNSGNAPPQYAQSNQPYDYLSQQQQDVAPRYSVQNNGIEGVPVISGYSGSAPGECWPDCP